jgi:PhnB protein
MAAKKPAKKKTAKKTARKAPARRAKRAKAAPRKATGGFRLESATPSFTVDDLPRSLAWYRDVLGCSVVERWERGGVLMGVELSAGGVGFMIGQDDWKKGRDRKKGEGFRIYCETRQDLDAMARGIQSRGGVLDHPPQDEPWGGRDFSLTDPDGFKITIATPWR